MISQALTVQEASTDGMYPQLESKSTAKKRKKGLLGWEPGNKVRMEEVRSVI
jgi:hypothetical protein